MPRVQKKLTGRWATKEAPLHMDSDVDDEQPEKESTPAATSADVAKAKKAKNARKRSKKLLRPSLIRRICKTPSKRSLEAVASNIAEVMYTNSEFDPSYYSERGDWSLSTTDEEEEVVVRKKPTRRRTIAKKPKMVNKKPKKQVDKIRMMQSLLATDDDEDDDDDDDDDVDDDESGDEDMIMNDAAGMSSRKRAKPKNKKKKNLQNCLCTEVNGRMFKLFDLPAGLNDEMALHQYLRSLPQIVLKRRARK